MTKTISFKLSKRLDELWLLRDVETEYYWALDLEDTWIILSRDSKIPTQKEIKTLTLEEWKNFLNNIKWKENIKIDIFSSEILSIIWLWLKSNWITIEILEIMFTYLLDNNLIWQNLETH